MLLSHYKGRKRIHLELVDGLSKATDIKQKMFGIFKNTVTSIKDLMGSSKLVLNIKKRLYLSL